MQRIVSFLPAATEMIYALGMGQRLLGISHECDYPPEARGKPVVVRAALAVDQMSQAQIDAAVTQRLHEGLSLYQVDEQLIREIAPDLILTQDLCQVCAPSGNELSQLLASLAIRPQILSMTPKSLEEIFGNLQDLGLATGSSERARELILAARTRLARIAAKIRHISYRPRVFCMEWIDPVYCCGHWVPEMVELAGGIDALGRRGADSVRILWDEVLQCAPEVLIVMPCGYELERAAMQARALYAYPGWSTIPAVQTGRVYVVDANAYFARPGPRVIEGTELLAHLLHPALFDWDAPEQAYRRLSDDPGSAMALQAALSPEVEA